VNEYTRDMGEEGLLALETLLGRAAAAGLVPPMARIELV
jgi:predicted solute-binding protein